MATDVIESVLKGKLTFEADKVSLRQVQQQVANATRGNFIDDKTVQKFQKMLLTSAQSFNDVLGKAKMHGLRSEADAWEKKMSSAQGQIIDLIGELNKNQEYLKHAGERTRKRLLEENRTIKMRIMAARDVQEMELETAREVIKARKEAAESLENITSKEAAKSFGEAMTSTFSSVKAKDLEGMTQGFMGAIGKAGKMMQAKGGMMAAAAGPESGMAGAGAAKALGAIGTAAVAIGAVAGVLALVVKLMVDADAQAKEFNKTLMQGASAADFAYTTSAAGIIDVTEELSAAQDAAMSLALRFREDHKEIMAVLAAANEAGLTFKEMREEVGGAGDAMTAYSRFAEVAVVYSKTLGVEMKTIAEQTASWMHDLGLGLRGVEDGFSTIFQAAMESGIGVKRFYGMVTEATSSMALYNVRIEEAAALIGNLATALGDAGAAEFVKGLTQGFAADSYTERFKKIIIAGQGDVSEIMENSAVSTAKAFGKSFEGEIPGALERAAAGKVDLQGIMTGDVGALQELGKLPEDEIRALLQATGSDEQYRQMEKLIELSQGMTGGLGDQAKAMDAMDMGGKLSMMLQTLGDTPLSEMSAIELAAFESYAGISGEQLMALRKVDRSIRGEYDAIKGMQASLQRGEDLTADQIAKAEELGVEFDNTGRAFVKGTDQQIESVNDWIQSQEEVLAESVQEGMTNQEAIAKRTADNTSSIMNSIDTVIAMTLKKIYDVMRSLLDMAQGMNPAEIEARDSLIHAAEDQQATLQSELGANAQAIAEAKDAYETASGKDKTARKEELDVLVGQREELETAAGLQEVLIQDLNDIQGGGLTGFDKTAEDMMAETQRKGRERRREVMAGTMPGKLAAFEGGAGETAYTAKLAELVEREEDRRTRAGKEGPIPDSLMKQFEGRAEEAKLVAVDEEIAKLMEGQVEQAEEQAGQEAVESQEQVTATTEVQKAVAASAEGRTSDLIDALMAMKLHEALSAGGFRQGTKEYNELFKGLHAGQVEAQDTLLARYRSTGEGVSEAQSAAGAQVGVFDLQQDFIYRGNRSGGTLTPISQADDLIGGKPGGPVEAALGGRGGGMVNVNVYGGDQARVYETVKKALRDSGLRTPPGGR